MRVRSELGRKDPELTNKDSIERRQRNGEVTLNEVLVNPELVTGTELDDTLVPGDFIRNTLVEEVGYGGGVRSR